MHIKMRPPSSCARHREPLKLHILPRTLDDAATTTAPCIKSSLQEAVEAALGREEPVVQQVVHKLGKDVKPWVVQVPADSLRVPKLYAGCVPLEPSAFRPNGMSLLSSQPAADRCAGRMLAGT
jgi:hypothetical protein